MGFSRQEYWSGLSCPPPGDLPDPGTELASLTSPALTGGFFTTSATWEAPTHIIHRNVNRESGKMRQRRNMFPRRKRKQNGGKQSTYKEFEVTIILILILCVLVTQLSLTLCHTIYCSPPGSSVHGIIQTRMLQWVAVFYSRAPSSPRNQT